MLRYALAGLGVQLIASFAISVTAATAASTSSALFIGPKLRRTVPLGAVPICLWISGAQCKPVLDAMLKSTSRSMPTSAASRPSMLRLRTGRRCSKLVPLRSSPGRPATPRRAPFPPRVFFPRPHVVRCTPGRNEARISRARLQCRLQGGRETPRGEAGGPSGRLCRRNVCCGCRPLCPVKARASMFIAPTSILIMPAVCATSTAK